MGKWWSGQDRINTKATVNLNLRGFSLSIFSCAAAHTTPWYYSILRVCMYLWNRIFWPFTTLNQFFWGVLLKMSIHLQCAAVFSHYLLFVGSFPQVSKVSYSTLWQVLFRLKKSILQHDSFLEVVPKFFKKIQIISSLPRPQQFLCLFCKNQVLVRCYFVCVFWYKKLHVVDNYLFWIKKYIQYVVYFRNISRFLYKVLLILRPAAVKRAN